MVAQWIERPGEEVRQHLGEEPAADRVGEKEGRRDQREVEGEDQGGLQSNALLQHGLGAQALPVGESSCPRPLSAFRRAA